MTIIDLIEEAKKKDPEFKRKIEHRLNKRKKSPDFEWLMDQLEKVLGKEYVRKAARDFLNGK
jgi:hypothetical protein